MRPQPILGAAALLALASCSALTAPQRYGTPNQRLMVTASKVTYDEYDASDPTNSAGLAFNSEPDVDGWSAQVDLYFKGPSVLVGYSDRDYGDAAKSDEVFAGGRYFWGGDARVFYLMGVVRVSSGLEVAGTESDNYWGWGLGAGSTAQMTDNFFIDVRLMYEDLFSEIDFGANEVELDGLVGTIGVAWVQ